MTLSVLKKTVNELIIYSAHLSNLVMLVNE